MSVVVEIHVSMNTCKGGVQPCWANAERLECSPLRPPTHTDTLAVRSCLWLSHPVFYLPAAWTSSGTLFSLLLGILDCVPVAPWNPTLWGLQPSWFCQLLPNIQQKLTGLLCGEEGKNSQHAKCFAFCPHSDPRRSVWWLLSFTERLREGR
jgi:hypothetical protein